MVNATIMTPATTQLFSGQVKMPHNPTILDFFSRHAEAIGLMLLAALAVIGRAFYTGAPWRQAVGDLILCPLFTFVVIPIIPERLTILGMSISITPDMAAVAIGVAGVHGLRYIAALKNKRAEIFKTKDQTNG